MTNYDVIVVGVGGMGSATVYHLARRGVRVLGIEQFGVAHDRGSSHGKTRAIRQAYSEGPDYVPLVVRAYDLWRELEREAGTTLLTTTGALYIGPSDAPHMAGAALSARVHRIPYEVLTAEEVRRRYPVMHPRPSDIGIVEHQAGFLVPERCVAAHIELACRHDAAVHLNEPVISWTADHDSVSVRTVVGAYEAGQLVFTAGPWTGQLLDDLHLPLSVERVVLYWFEPRARIAEFERLPTYSWTVDGIVMYGFPYLQGQGLKVAFHQVFQEATSPHTIRREVGEDEKRRMRTYLNEFMPDGAGCLLTTATCMYTNTSDFHFIIDRHPIHPNVVLACGFSGHGFKFCSVVGEALADLVTRGETILPIGLFALNRFTPRP